MLTQYYIIVWKILVLYLLGTACVDAEVVHVGVPDADRALTIMLGRTPNLAGPVHNGHGALIAQIAFMGAVDGGLHRVKIVAISRLWKRDSSRDAAFEQRVWPQIQAIPFDDENGVIWTLVNGKEYRLGDEIILSSDELVSLQRAVPEYVPDRRNFLLRIGLKGVSKVLVPIATAVGIWANW